MFLNTLMSGGTTLIGIVTTTVPGIALESVEVMLDGRKTDPHHLCTLGLCSICVLISLKRFWCDMV